jgi:hypothetical protein
MYHKSKRIRLIIALMLATDMVPETSVVFNKLTLLIA